MSQAGLQTLPQTPGTQMGLQSPATGIASDGFQVVKARISIIHRAMKETMVKDVHFGVIPGTDKPALLKPGAEMVCALFQLSPSVVPTHITDLPDVTRSWKARRKDWYENAQGRKDFRWIEEEGETVGYYEVLCTATLTDPYGRVIATAAGSCNNLENKYRNMSVWDVRNTIVKMAGKRALVAVVLLATGASDMFAQDVDDDPETLLTGSPAAKAAPSRPASGKPDAYGNAITDKQVSSAKGHADRLKLDYESSRAVVMAVSNGDKGAARAFMDAMFSKDDEKIKGAFLTHPAFKQAPAPAQPQPAPATDSFGDPA